MLAIAGCASGPKFSEMQSSMPTLKAGEGRIYVYRDSTFGAAIVPSVYVNGREVGRSMANSFFYVDRAPGEYKVSATTEVERSVSLALAAGESKYVKVSIGLACSLVARTLNSPMKLRRAPRCSPCRTPASKCAG